MTPRGRFKYASQPAPITDYIAAIIAIAIGTLFAATTAHQWDYLWDGEYLGKWASLVAVYSLGFTPLWYFMKKKLDGRRERRTASIGAMAELANAADGLDAEKHGDLKVATLAKGQEVHFMNRMLNHGTYDSLVMSGRIIAIKAELQQPIHDVFQIIKDRNSLLQKIRDMEEAGGRQSSADRYYLQLSRVEERLLDAIPPLLDELRKECGLSSTKKRRLGGSWS